MSDQHYTTSGPQRRHRPSRRIADPGAEARSSVLTEEFQGLAVAYGSTLLFIGYEVEGLVELTIYPRYRFSSDDRVQGHLGYVRVPLGASWQEILTEVEEVYAKAEENYRMAVNLRAREVRAHGARYESAYEAVTEAFRESWHGFALRLRREGAARKEGVSFEGEPPAPVLAQWGGKTYTVHVYPTGSILMLTGDRRELFDVR